MYMPDRYTSPNLRRHNHGLSGCADPGLGFSLPSWLTGAIKSVTMTASQAAAQAIKNNTNVTIAGRTFNLGNPADLAALKAMAQGVTSGSGVSPVKVTFTNKPLPMTMADLATNPLVLGVGAVLALKFIFRK